MEQFRIWESEFRKAGAKAHNPNEPEAKVAWARCDCAGAEAPKPTHPEGILQRLRGKGSQCEGAKAGAKRESNKPEAKVAWARDGCEGGAYLKFPNPQFEFRN